MRGQVVTRSKGRIAVRTDGGITVADVDSGEAERGDFITGPLESLGGQQWHNETRGTALRVHVEDMHCSIEVARQLLTG